MISHFKLITLFLFFGLIAGQPPKPNGRDRGFLTPIDPPSETQGRIAPLSFFPRPRPSDPTPTPCARLMFREVTGRCTNRRDETFGEARRVHFSYFDVDSTEFPETDLKSARVISNALSDQGGVDIFNDRSLNELLVFFGQFLDHNVVATPLSDEEEDIEPPEGSEEELPFRRSERAKTGDGDGERPVNILSSIVDLVAVYGPSEIRNEALRVPNSCKLKTSEGDLLPFNVDGFSNAPSTDPKFYFAGDQRSNEHPVLTCFHTLWVREHNHLCDLIGRRLPFLSQNKLYEAARAVNIAEFQKVVFEEFFPAITGRSLRRFRGFRIRVNPSLSSLFSTAAFRVGHTMIGENLMKVFADGTRVASPLRENFFVPDSVVDGIDPFLRGAAQTQAQEIDVKVVDSLRNFLFQDVPQEEGPDLIALNIQRGRDHNIPSFNEIRREFRIPKANTFADISSDPEIQGRLAAAYDSPDDVEAWPGFMAEDKVRGSSFGRTLLAVWILEFTRLRDGDMFSYLGRRAFPRRLRRPLRDIIRVIRSPRIRIFRDLIVRNTDIAEGDLNRRDVFRVKS